MKNYIKCIMACLIAVFSLMSCNDDNSDRDLTPEEINSIIKGFNGHYQGKLISATDYNADTKRFLQNDTIMTEASFGLDTTVTFSGFPVTYLAKKIKSPGNADLKDALEDADIVNASGKFVPRLMNPMSVLVNYLNFPLEYGGKQHSVTISFMQYYSFAQFSSSKVVMQLLPAAVYVDGNLAEDILQSSQSVDLAYSFNQV
ncbi:MAG: DUF4840 domain-containing protein [Bacteroidales bacterium]|nr:DUF4840 domain-containing protein [Bacteroidales bacterium]MDY6001533.1 DUF4840 domain-containing protein [Candidatus Cryptobacteroides sp.]